MNDYVPKCGDVGFVGYEQGYGFVVDRISDVTTGRNESLTKADHQFQVIEGAQIIEADAAIKKRRVVKRLVVSRLDQCRPPKVHYIIFRPPTCKYTRGVIHETALNLVGKRYGYLEIILHAIDGRLRKWGWLKERFPLFTRLGGLAPWTVICSGASNRCLYEAKVLSRRFLYLAPDGTFDEAISRGWEVVAQDENGADYWCLPNREGS